MGGPILKGTSYSPQMKKPKGTSNMGQKE